MAVGLYDGNGGAGGDINFGQYEDDVAAGNGNDMDEGVMNGLLDGEDTDMYSGLRPDDGNSREAFQGDTDRDGFLGQDGDNGDNDGADDSNDDGRQRRFSNVGGAQRRGPQPGFMGQGAMSGRQRQLLGQDFWNTPNEQQKPLSPSERFFAQLTERLSGQGQQTPGPADEEAAARQQDSQWQQFFGQRNFGQTADQLLEAFGQAGSDPEKSTRILHGALQQMSRDVYRQIATDMQPTIVRIAETMAQRIVDQKLQAVTSERGYTNALTSLLNRNPQWRQLGAYPGSALKQALVHTNGDMQRALTLTERHIRESLALVASRRNTGRNQAGGNSVNWHNEARR